MIRPHATAARLIDDKFQLECLFDYTSLASPPCPNMTKNFTEFHPVQGLDNAYLAFINKPRLQKRDIQEVKEEVVAPVFMNGALIRPYISSFNCLSQEAGHIKLSSCVRFSKDDDFERINQKATAAFQNYRIF